MKLADRRYLIDSSGIRKAFDLAAKLKDPINLSIGLPDYDVPEVVKGGAITAIQGGKNRYTLSAGIPPLREAVKKRYHDRGINVEDVMISSGTSGALVLLFNVLLDPGEEVLAADPYFVMYKHLVNMVGAKPVFVDTYPDFRLTEERLNACLTDKTRVLVVNSPSNPTGIVYTPEECKMLAEFAKKHDLWLISDEIYEDFCFEGKLSSPAEFYDKTIVINGFSKSVAMTGWRVGWVAGPSDVVQACTEFQQYTFVCSPSMAQEAALTALEYDTTPHREEFTKRRDLIYQGLVDAGYNVQKPGGAFYIFPEAPNGDGNKFIEEAVKENLIIVPGSVFSEKKTHFRISFATNMEKLQQGVEVLGKLAEKFKVGA